MFYFTALLKFRIAKFLMDLNMNIEAKQQLVQKLINEHKPIFAQCVSASLSSSRISFMKFQHFKYEALSSYTKQKQTIKK